MSALNPPDPRGRMVRVGFRVRAVGNSRPRKVNLNKSTASLARPPVPRRRAFMRQEFYCAENWDMGIIAIDVGGFDPSNYAIVKACGAVRQTVMVVRTAASAHLIAQHFFDRLSPGERADGWTFWAEATSKPISYHGHPSHGRRPRKAKILEFPAA